MTDTPWTRPEYEPVDKRADRLRRWADKHDVTQRLVFDLDYLVGEYGLRGVQRALGLMFPEAPDADAHPVDERSIADALVGIVCTCKPHRHDVGFPFCSTARAAAVAALAVMQADPHTEIDLHPDDVVDDEGRMLAPDPLDPEIDLRPHVRVVDAARVLMDAGALAQPAHVVVGDWNDRSTWVSADGSPVPESPPGGFMVISPAAAVRFREAQTEREAGTGTPWRAQIDTGDGAGTGYRTSPVCGDEVPGVDDHVHRCVSRGDYLNPYRHPFHLCECGATWR